MRPLEHDQVDTYQLHMHLRSLNAITVELASLPRSSYRHNYIVVSPSVRSVALKQRKGQRLISSSRSKRNICATLEYVRTKLATEAPNDHHTRLRRSKSDSTPALCRGNPLPRFWLLGIVSVGHSTGFIGPTHSSSIVPMLYCG